VVAVRPDLVRVGRIGGLGFGPLQVPRTGLLAGELAVQVYGSTPATALAVAAAMVLVAYGLMIVRPDVASQAIGFFSLMRYPTDSGVTCTAVGRFRCARLPRVRGH